MTGSPIIGLVNNAALLVCLVVLYDIVVGTKEGCWVYGREILSGICLGVIGVFVMLNPWELMPGIFFDTRSVLLSVSGLFWGWVPTVIAGGLTAVFRMHSGGTGMVTGLGVIMTSAAVGLVWRSKIKHLDRMTIKDLYAMGMTVHVLMLLWMLTLPWPAALDVLAKIFIPVLVAFPLVTVLSGKLIFDRHRSALDRDHLKQSRERFQLAMDASQDGLWDWNLETGQIYFSPGWKRILGYSPEEIENRVSEWDRLTCERDAMILHGLIDQITQGKIDRFNIELKMRHKEGVGVDVLSRGRAIRDIKGRALRVVGTLVDLTSLRQVEKDLRKSRDRYETILKTAMDGFWLVTHSGGIVDVNVTYCAMSGFSRSELLSMNISDIDAVEDPDMVRMHIQKVMTIGQDRFESRHRKKDGSFFDVDVSVQFRQENEAFLVVFIRDITDRKKYIENLEKSQEQYLLALEGSKDGIWDWDLTNNTLYFSSRLNKMLGYDDWELSRDDSAFEALLHPEDRQRVLDKLNQYLEGVLANYSVECRLRKKNGDYLWIYTRGKALRDEQGQPYRMAGSLTDITERKHWEEQLQKIQRMEAIGTLAGGIAHDFNNILFPVIGMAELLIEDLPEKCVERENAEQILKAGLRGSRLVKQILAFSRQTEHELMPVRLQDVCKEVVKLIRATIPSNIEIRQRLQKDCGLVLADETHIHQVAMNLITNAYHAVEKIKNGRIEVILEERPKTASEKSKGIENCENVAVLTIKDNGVGIGPEHLDKIFEPYFTTKPQGKGTGLGLAVVYGIVNEYKGEISVLSEPASGTVFQVFFPVIKDQEAPYSSSYDEPMERGSGRILLIDDEEPVARILTMMLERLGYTVLKMTNSKAALDVFKSGPDQFDLVISDLAMPNMTGDELAREILSIRPEVPVIICTGFSDRFDEQSASQLGVKGLLMKPVIKTQMAHMVRSVLICPKTDL